MGWDGGRGGEWWVGGRGGMVGGRERRNDGVGWRERRRMVGGRERRNGGREGGRERREGEEEWWEGGREEPQWYQTRSIIIACSHVYLLNYTSELAQIWRQDAVHDHNLFQCKCSLQ